MEANNTNEFSDLKPTVGSSYGFGWNILWKTFIEIFVVFIVYGIIQMPTGMFGWGDNEFHWFYIPMILFAMTYGIFLAGPIGYSTKWVYLKAVRREKIEIKDMFSVFQRNYWNAVIASIVVGLIVGFGIVMAIVPGIIFACRLAFVPYLVIDRKMEALEALKTSWEMTRGHGWTIFLMGLLAIPLAIAGLVVLFFGVFIAGMWISVAFAAIYYAVCRTRGELLTSINQE